MIKYYSKADIKRQNGERDLQEDIYIRTFLSSVPQAKVVSVQFWQIFIKRCHFLFSAIASSQDAFDDEEDND